MEIPAVPKPQNPELHDKVIGDMQTILKTRLTWLDHAFGRAQRLVEIKDKKHRFFPGLFIGPEYINLFPDQERGNYCFFNISDPQQVEPEGIRVFSDITTRCSIIFWLDTRDVFPNSDDFNTENVKKLILDVIRKHLNLINGRFTVYTIYELAENIYKGYNVKEIESQFLMHPYTGFRFEGELKIVDAC